MNSRVSDLTEIAFEIMGYEMYDRNGAPTDSLSQVIQPHLADALNSDEAEATPDLPSCSSPRDTEDFEEAFKAEFGILDPALVLEDPREFADKQIGSLLEMLEARIMGTKVMRYSKSNSDAIRAQNAQANEIKIAYFCNKLKQDYADALYKLEVDVGATWSQTDQEIRAAYDAKAHEQLEEFNMLVDLLKIILEDMPDNWRELDTVCTLMKTTIDMFKSIE